MPLGEEGGKIHCLVTYIVKMEITFLFVSEVQCVQPAGLDLHRISRSSQDRRQTLRGRGKCGGAGIVVWAITKYFDNTLLRSLGIAVTVF